MDQEKIEILPTSLLDENRQTVDGLKRLAKSLGLEFGWHYLLDLTWIIANLGSVNRKYIMDAGAGTGLLQWYLADQGAKVLSVDRGSRADLPVRFRRRFQVSGLRTSLPDLIPTRQLVTSSLTSPKKLYRHGREFIGGAFHSARAPGTDAVYPPDALYPQVIIYNQDLLNLVDIPANSLDAVVAVSALEHNDPDNLVLVVNELLRVLKPGGMLLATLCAAPDRDWFHTPSAGWCYTDQSLRRIFNLPDDIPSNYAEYARLFQDLQNCAELRDNLAKFYSRSGDNGMPWGKWDPQYQPVGVCKIKEGADDL